MEEKLILSQTDLQRVRNGLVRGMEVAMGARSSATYYHKREEQVAATQAAVRDLFAVSREIPLILACQRGATGFFVQEVILNELRSKTTDGACRIVDPREWIDGGIAGSALLTALSSLDEDAGITYVLRMFESLRGVNKDRARRVVLHFLLGHKNLEFIVVKYRKKVRTALEHAWGRRRTSILLSIADNYTATGVYRKDQERSIFGELLGKYTADIDRTARCVMFAFKRGTARTFPSGQFPVISQYWRARTDISDCKLVPEEVLVGLVGDKRHPQHAEMWSTKEKQDATRKMIRERTVVTSANTQQRQVKQDKKIGVQRESRTEQVTDFLALYKTGYETGFTPEINDAIEKLARSKRAANLPYRNIGLIVDQSPSMSGHSEQSKNTPKAIAAFTALVLEASADSCTKVYAGGDVTDLAGSFLDLVEAGGDFDAIFVLSDGYENGYDGLLAEVVAAWRELTNASAAIYHAAPIVGAETGATVRSLGSGIGSLAISRPEGLVAQIESKLLDADPRMWLDRQVQRLATRVRRQDRVQS